MSSEMQELVKAIKNQTAAINKLAESNQQVISLLTEVVGSMIEDGEELPPLNYLDGTPRG